MKHPISDKIDLKWSDTFVALYNASIYYTRENIKKSYNNNKFKISWNEKFESRDGTYFMSDIQNYFTILYLLVYN